MNPEVTRFYKFVETLKQFNPKLQVKFKDESNLMKIIGLFLFFNKSFSNFATTIGNTIFMPSRKYVNDSPKNAIILVAHEYRHVSDSKKFGGIIFSLLYAMPQLFALGILLSPILGPWVLLFLLFLLPIPSYSRMRLEVNGYTMSLFMHNEYLKYLGADKETRRQRLQKTVESFEQYFNGPAYYFMWPFGAKTKLLNNLELIFSGDIVSTSEAFQQVRIAFDKTK